MIIFQHPGELICEQYVEDVEWSGGDLCWRHRPCKPVISKVCSADSKEEVTSSQEICDTYISIMATMKFTYFV
jgi:hypothetical protein